MMTRRFSLILIVNLFFYLGCLSSAVAGEPLTRCQAITALGQEANGVKAPQRIVSLYPEASEILSALGKADAVVGISLHDTTLPDLANKTIVGSFAQPSLERILALQPDLVILGSQYQGLAEALNQKEIPVLVLDTNQLANAATNIRCLGNILNVKDNAEKLVARETSYQQLVAKKLANVPERQPLRVMRLIGFVDGDLLVPGDDSFQNELISKAGGIPPKFAHNGATIRINAAQWREFNPELVYFSGLDPTLVKQMLSDPQWSAVSAVQQHRLLSFPQELTSRAATHYGYFSLWLSAELNSQAFSQLDKQAQPDQIWSQTSLPLPFDYVAKASTVDVSLFDFPAKTLLVQFNSPQQILSSLHGWRDGIMTVGNHYTSPPSWSVTHYLGLKLTNERTMDLLGIKAENSVLLFTGADMDKLAYVQLEENGLQVAVFATAGVKSNAMRASVDVGSYIEPGTINLIILTNRRLTPEAMTRAMITATEAKTAVIEDLDIRSSYTATPATGTGTDNIIVVGGSGAPATMIGGHVKLGELLARATYQAVNEAIYKQHGMTASRDIFQRLQERKIDLRQLIADSWVAQGSTYNHKTESMNDLVSALEQTLLQPRYADFLATALAVADSQARGLIVDTSAFSAWNLMIAGELAGHPVSELQPFFVGKQYPPVLYEALNALATGLFYKLEQRG